MCSANNYHLRNADDKLAVPLPKTEFLKKNFSKNETVVKLWLRLMSLFQPIDHMRNINLSFKD